MTFVREPAKLHFSVCVKHAGVNIVKKKKTKKQNLSLNVFGQMVAEEFHGIVQTSVSSTEKGTQQEDT